MAVGDSALVHRMERGRSLTLRMAGRVLAFIADHEGGSGGARDPLRRPWYRKPSREPTRTKKCEARTDQPRNERSKPRTRILRLPEVMARTGLSRATIYRWRAAPTGVFGASKVGQPAYPPWPHSVCLPEGLAGGCAPCDPRNGNGAP